MSKSIIHTFISIILSHINKQKEWPKHFHLDKGFSFKVLSVVSISCSIQMPQQCSLKNLLKLLHSTETFRQAKFFVKNITCCSTVKETAAGRDRAS